jgi:hypothetical protein
MSDTTRIPKITVFDKVCHSAARAPNEVEKFHTSTPTTTSTIHEISDFNVLRVLLLSLFSSRRVGDPRDARNSASVIRMRGSSALCASTTRIVTT